MYDVLVIGAGIVGSLLAYELSKYELKVLVLDKENDVANESTRANSAIIHAGFDPVPQTLKSKLNIEGSNRYPMLCETLKVNYKQIGSLTVASNEEELEMLQVLKQRADECGIDVSLIDGETVRQLEPNLSTHIMKALYCKSTAIVYPWEVAIAAMEVALLNGVELKLNHEVHAISKINDSFEVKTGKGKFQARVVINAAGVFADEIAKLINPSFHIEVTPRRGTYFVLDKDFNDVKHVIYPTPTKNGKGVLITPTTHGNTLLGPDATLIEQKDDLATTIDAFDYVKEQLLKLLPSFPASHVMRSFTGVRASSSYKDFYIQPDLNFDAFVNVVGIDSPGLSAAPAIAEYLLDFIRPHVSLHLKEVHCLRQAPVDFKSLSREEKNALIQKNPAYGRMVCRCEQITEGEILDAIHRLAGARTVKGIKKRCRPGMGKCQGSFCEPLVLQILARELNEPLLNINYDEEDTSILVEEK